jgi:hypothetical protein
MRNEITRMAKVWVHFSCREPVHRGSGAVVDEGRGERTQKIWPIGSAAGWKTEVTGAPANEVPDH